MLRFAKIFVWIVAINFIAFAIGAIWFGGDAISGHASGGHYFLGMKRHLTEVSPGVFAYSRWHTISVMVTMPIALVVNFFRLAIEKALARERAALKAL